MPSQAIEDNSKGCRLLALAWDGTHRAAASRSSHRRSLVNSSIVTVVSSAVVASGIDQVAGDLIVWVAAEVQAVTAALDADDRAHGLLSSIGARADLTS